MYACPAKVWATCTATILGKEPFVDRISVSCFCDFWKAKKSAANLCLAGVWISCWHPGLNLDQLWYKFYTCNYLSRLPIYGGIHHQNEMKEREPVSSNAGYQSWRLLILYWTSMIMASLHYKWMSYVGPMKIRASECCVDQGNEIHFTFKLTSAFYNFPGKDVWGPVQMGSHIPVLFTTYNDQTTYKDPGKLARFLKTILNILIHVMSF